MSTATADPKVSGSNLPGGSSISDVQVSGIPNGTHSYKYEASGTSTPKPNVNDASFDQDIRIAMLYIFIILGSIGGALVLLWLWFNRRRKSRVNALILHVCLSDLLVIFGACLTQLIWEYNGRHWGLGDVVCKLLKFLQSFVMMASNYMLVVLSIDRHQAIRAPLREPFKVWKMAGIGWSLAAILSTPQFHVFHTYYNTDVGPFQNMTLCESIWRLRPLIERKIYLCFVPMVVFVVPFCIITFCYIRIFLKIAQKANEGRSQVMKPGKVHLQSTPSSSLPKAKIKTLKMTCVIVSVFLICGLPYFILEMIYNFGDHTMIPSYLAGFLGSMAVANSAANPWVFLLFNVNLKCLQFAFGNCFSLQSCLGMDFNSRRGVYDSTRTDYTSMDVKDASTRGNLKHDINSVHANNKEVMEMSYKAKATATKPNVHYTRMSAAP